MTERKVFLLRLNRAAVLNVILKGQENRKRKKVAQRKKNAIKRSKPKTAKKIQKKLRSPEFNYKVKNKKQMFLI